MTALPPAGLYAITSAAICVDEATLMRAATAALEGGAVLLQYRDKLNDAATRLLHARRLQRLCREARVPLLINDGPAGYVAAEGFDGMHLGVEDGGIAAARAAAPQALIGATCGGSLDRALVAQAAGASYVAFGAFHASGSKPLATRADLSVLAEARQQLRIPICAIGGVTPDNGAALIAAGAHYLAAIEGVFGAKDVRAAARAYAALFA